MSKRSAPKKRIMRSILVMGFVLDPFEIRAHHDFLVQLLSKFTEYGVGFFSKRLYEAYCRVQTEGSLLQLTEGRKKLASFLEFQLALKIYMRLFEVELYRL